MVNACNNAQFAIGDQNREIAVALISGITTSINMMRTIIGGLISGTGSTTTIMKAVTG